MTDANWKANAVLIPAEAVDQRALRGELHVDPDLCTLLYLDGDRSEGSVYEKEAWESGGFPSYILSNGSYYKVKVSEDGFWECEPEAFCRAGLSIMDQEPVPYPHIALLPEMWVLKKDETEYWEGLDEVGIKRVFGVYLVNKSVAVHLCEFTPSYRLHRLESQYEPAWDDSAEVSSDRHEKAMEWIRNGEVHDDPITYIHCHEVDLMLANPLRCHYGDTPKKGVMFGGYWCEVSSVTEDDAIAEIREWTCNGDL